ncbi:hypothetical protein OO013_03750 [Mangrovivirga sp. M17]|uniref:DUF4178 domain-containing protein n=1 Tax=Mangrovivirga halotolerans TaxID=2993936 RepID=A0ABT3RMC0_9BACT|nr:hypothetical protein [Mangrovivirga halotolerans]MCX2742964.1 hypothetical protein [Mangrovivirga halotolerans]
MEGLISEASKLILFQNKETKILLSPKALCLKLGDVIRYEKVRFYIIESESEIPRPFINTPYHFVFTDDGTLSYQSFGLKDKFVAELSKYITPIRLKSTNVVKKGDVLSIELDNGSKFRSEYYFNLDTGDRWYEFYLEEDGNEIFSSRDEYLNDIIGSGGLDSILHEVYPDSSMDMKLNFFNAWKTGKLGKPKKEVSSKRILAFVVNVVGVILVLTMILMECQG